MKPRLKQVVFIIADAVIAAFSVVAALWVFFQGHIISYYIRLIDFYWLVSCLSVFVFGVLFGSYRKSEREVDFSDVIRQGAVAGMSGFVYLIIKYCIDGMLVSGSITLIYCGFTLVLTVLLRGIPSFVRQLKRRARKNDDSSIRAIIIGAGTSGAMVIRQLTRDADSGIYPVAVLDSDPTKKGWYIEGLKIYGGISDVARVAQRTRASLAIIAIPSASAEARQEIFGYCRAAGITTQTIQSSFDMQSYLDGKRNLIRDVSFDSVRVQNSERLELTAADAGFEGKTVALFAGLDYLDAELCAQTAVGSPARMIIFAQDVRHCDELFQRAKTANPALECVTVVGNRSIASDVEGVFSGFAPAVVYNVAPSSGDLVAELASSYKPERLINLNTELTVSMQTQHFGQTPPTASEEEIQGFRAYLKTRRGYLFVKRAFDLVLSFIGILVLAIPMAIISLLIINDSRGPVLFRQVRVGRDHRDFVIFKFRTMYVNAPKDMATRMLENPDSFITPIGRILRRTSLDELPQLFNIFSGEMSIIGPRPVIRHEPVVLEREKNGANLIRPGLTGLAQINGRDEIDDVQKAAYDSEYFRSLGLRVDMKIFFKTVWKVLKRDGIREGK